MFKQIRTSENNKEKVGFLSRKLDLGFENTIARIALAFSLSRGLKLNLNDIQNSSGKSYTRGVLFGDFEDYYIGLVAVHYGIYKTDSDIPKYIKMHIDHGLELIYEEVQDNPNFDGFDYVTNMIENGMSDLTKV